MCKRGFAVLCARIEEGGSLDFSVFWGELTNEELGMFVGLCKADERLPASKAELNDCIATLQSEQAKQQRRTVQAGALGDAEFAALFHPDQKKNNPS